MDQRIDFLMDFFQFLSTEINDLLRISFAMIYCRHINQEEDLEVEVAGHFAVVAVVVVEDLEEGMRFFFTSLI